MNGIIRYIRKSTSHYSLIDSTGVERSFRRSALMDKTIEEHDVVSFDLDGSVVTNIELVKKHQKDTVFSWT